ncbi:hypothetical protein ACM66B_003654 [Microbotryomycetes sp. NB124-2]
MSVKVSAVIALLAVAASSGNAAVFNSRNVKHLTGKTFKKAVQGSDKLTLAAFVAPWCGYCQKLAPEYDRAADNLKGLVNLVSVDCDADENKSLCAEQGIQGFPTIKTFPGGSAPSRAYDGPREGKAIVDYATKNMPTFVKRATSAKEAEALKAKSAKKPIALLFTSAASVTPLYKALSTEFHKQIDFYAARDSKVGQETLQSFGVDKVPALLVLHGEEVTNYKGALKYDALAAFFKPFATKGKGNRDEL